MTASPPSLAPSTTPKRSGRWAIGHTTQGILYLIIAVMGFSLMDATAKRLVQHYPTLQVVWMRFVGQVILVSAILMPHLHRYLRTRHPVFHLLRAGCQIGAVICFFLSLSYIGLAEATALGELSPVLITLGACLFLGEKLGRIRILGVCISMIGAMIVIRPGSDIFSFAALLPLATAGFFAASALFARHMGNSESHWTAMMLSGLIGTVVIGLLQPGIWQPIRLSDLPFFAMAAVFGTIGQLCLFKAYSSAEAGVIAPFGYFGLVFATLWGIFFFGEWPDIITLFGILVIAGAGIYVWYRETRGGKASATDV